VFANSVRKIGFWNVESRVVAVLQSNHFRIVTLTTAAVVSLSLSFYWHDDNDGDGDDDEGDDGDDDGILL
jgi:hypothetical protein